MLETLFRANKFNRSSQSFHVNHFKGAVEHKHCVTTGNFIFASRFPRARVSCHPDNPPVLKAKLAMKFTYILLNKLNTAQFRSKSENGFRGSNITLSTSVKFLTLRLGSWVLNVD